MGVYGQHHVPAALPQRKTRYPLYSRLDGPPSAGLDGCGKSRPPHTGIRSQDRPARSKSLYRLSYRCRIFFINVGFRELMPTDVPQPAGLLYNPKS
jgi:hypothetical protein